MHFRRERPAEDAEGQRSGVEQHVQEVPQQRSCHRDGRRLRRIKQRLEGAVPDVQTQVRQQSPSAHRRPARIRGKSCHISTVAVVSLSAANPREYKIPPPPQIAIHCTVQCMAIWGWEVGFHIFS